MIRNLQVCVAFALVLLHAMQFLSGRSFPQKSWTWVEYLRGWATSDMRSSMKYLAESSLLYIFEAFKSYVSKFWPDYIIVFTKAACHQDSFHRPRDVVSSLPNLQPSMMQINGSQYLCYQ